MPSLRLNFPSAEVRIEKICTRLSSKDTFAGVYFGKLFYLYNYKVDVAIEL